MLITGLDPKLVKVFAEKNVYFGGHFLALCDQFVMSGRKQQIISNNNVFTHIGEQHIVFNFKFNELEIC